MELISLIVINISIMYCFNAINDAKCLMGRFYAQMNTHTKQPKSNSYCCYNNSFHQLSKRCFHEIRMLPLSQANHLIQSATDESKLIAASLSSFPLHPGNWRKPIPLAVVRKTLPTVSSTSLAYFCRETVQITYFLFQ